MSHPTGRPFALISIDVPSQVAATDSVIESLRTVLSQYRLPVTWGARSATQPLQRIVRGDDELALRPVAEALRSGRLRCQAEIGRLVLDAEQLDLACTTLVVPESTAIHYELLADHGIVAVRTPQTRGTRTQPLRNGVWQTTPTVVAPAGGWLRDWSAHRTWRQALVAPVVHLVIDLDRGRVPNSSQVRRLQKWIETVGQSAARDQLLPRTPGQVAAQLVEANAKSTASQSILRRAA